MEYLLQFYLRKGLFLYHFQKNEENLDLKFLSPIFESQSAILRASRIQHFFRLPTIF